MKGQGVQVRVKVKNHCITLSWRQKVGGCSAHAKHGGCRMRQQWELGVRFWLFGPHWSSCQKIEMMQCALFYCDFWKQKFQHGAFLLSTLPPHLTELSKVFQAGCFNFAQMKASAIATCINRLSDAAAKSELEANCEKSDRELGELRTPDGLVDSCVSSGNGVWEWHRKSGKLIIPIYKMRDRSELTNYRCISLLSLPGSMPRCR